MNFTCLFKVQTYLLLNMSSRLRDFIIAIFLKAWFSLHNNVFLLIFCCWFFCWLIILFDLLLYPLQTKLQGYIVILMSLRSFVRPSFPICNQLLLLDRWTEFHENFSNCSLHDAILHLLFLKFWRFPEQNKDFAITTYGGTHL